MDHGFYKNSIKTILENQSVWGSYIASPNFPTYQYCWLRDGSFIAHAMDTAGEYESAAAFFRWVGRTIQKFSYKVDAARKNLQAGLPMGKDDLLHTRYTPDGEEVTVDSTWGNFQIDGYGTWLWALSEHVTRTDDVSLVRELLEPIEITLKYLELVWKLPNYDCWEEYPEYLHPYSLATVYAGFQSAVDLIRSNKMNSVGVPIESLAWQVRDLILDSAVKNGRLVKYFCPPGKDSESRLIGNDGVDASLIGVSIPYQVLAAEDPIMQATIQAIEADLQRPGGGVYRYKADVYYGGGEWLLLTAWLGWYYASMQQYDKAKDLCRWIESQADENGFLAEQISEHTLYPDHYAPWVKKWGLIAKPLTWSHAMYVILVNAIKEGTA